MYACPTVFGDWLRSHRETLLTHSANPEQRIYGFKIWTPPAEQEQVGITWKLPFTSWASLRRSGEMGNIFARKSPRQLVQRFVFRSQRRDRGRQDKYPKKLSGRKRSYCDRKTCPLVLRREAKNTTTRSTPYFFFACGDILRRPQNVFARQDTECESQNLRKVLFSSIGGGAEWVLPWFIPAVKQLNCKSGVWRENIETGWWRELEVHRRPRPETLRSIVVLPTGLKRNYMSSAGTAHRPHSSCCCCAARQSLMKGIPFVASVGVLVTRAWFWAKGENILTDQRESFSSNLFSAATQQTQEEVTRKLRKRKIS